MESLKNIALVLGVIAFVYMGINGSFSTTSITAPTAQESIQNQLFIRFIVYTAILLAVIFITIGSKRFDIFLAMMAILSFIWYVVGKTWQA